MKELSSDHRITDLLNQEVTKEQFETLVGQVLSDEDKKLFGENALELVSQAILLPSVFATYPATFDSEAYAFVIDDLVADQGFESDSLIDTERVARLLTISLEAGIVEMNEEGRLYITEEVQEKVLPILDKYDE